MPSIWKWIDQHPSMRAKVRINCLVVVMVSVSCIAGHILHQPVLYAFGLSLGMSAVTAGCLILLATALMMVVRDPE